MTPEIKALQDQIRFLKRDYLIENLFVSEYIHDCVCDEDDPLCILITKAFDREYISLHYGQIDTPDRAWVNADGNIWVASGSNDPFLPQLDGNMWYCGDEIEQIGVWTEEDTQNYNMPSTYDSATGKTTKHFSHKNMMCIPEVERLRVTPQTAAIIWSTYLTEQDANDA